MLKGWFNGYSGLLFIYYRGENQLVLSDVNAGFNLGKNTLADTALRIVLKPNKWTQCAASYVQAGLEEGTSILAHLEKTGKVDIYTDAEEVKRIEASGLDPRDYEAGLAAQQQQAPMPQPQPAPMYQYNQQTGTPYYPDLRLSRPHRYRHSIWLQGNFLPFLKKPIQSEYMARLQEAQA